MRLNIVPMFLAMAVAFCASCGVTKRLERPDVVPPPSRDYKVIGKLSGLKGIVIQYDDRIFRGGDIVSSSASESLKKLGVKTIIATNPSKWERRFCRNHNFKLIELPFSKETGMTSSDLQSYLDAIRLESGPFYLHDGEAGTDKAGVLGLVYRLYFQGWDYDRAVIEFGRLGGSLAEDRKMLESVQNLQEPSFAKPQPTIGNPTDTKW